MKNTILPAQDTLHTLLNTLADSTLILDKEGNILVCNEKALQVICKNESNFYNKSIFDYLKENSAATVRTKKEIVIDSGSPISFEDKINGGIFQISIYPIFDNSNQVKQLVFFAADITNRKKIEQSEFMKTKQLEQILEIARNLSSSLDVKKVLTRICHGAKDLLNTHGSAIYILDKDGETLIPMVVIDPIYQKEVMATNLNVHKSLTGKAVLQKKCMIFNDTRPDSKGFQIPGTSVLKNERLIVAPFILEDKVLGVMTLDKIGSMYTQEDLSLAETFAAFATTALKNAQTYSKLQHEVEERKKAESDLSIHQEHLKLINKILRHDLMNNLAVIKSALRIYKSMKDEEVLNEATKSVSKSVELIKRMRELETFILSHDGFKVFDIRDVVEKVIRNYNYIEFNIQGKCHVLADNAITSVFDNIISNAAIHGQTDKIDITLKKMEDHCEIRIADYGSGVPDSIKEKIFDERFKYGKTGNTGIGLYIVKRTIEHYGGEISVKDNKPSGAVFVIKIRNKHNVKKNSTE